MEIEAKEKGKNRVVFEIKGEDHTFSNVLRDSLWEQKGVITSGYNIKHPLVGTPRFVAETESGDVISALESAAKDIKKIYNEFGKAISKF